MGAAKRRGTFEERKAQASNHDKEEAERLERFMEMGAENLRRVEAEKYNTQGAT